MQAAQETVQQVAESSKEAVNTGKTYIYWPESKNALLKKPGRKKLLLNINMGYICSHIIFMGAL